MSKNLVLNETQYNDVDMVNIPTAEGGVAPFVDVDSILNTNDATASAGDITENMTAYVKGVKVTGASRLKRTCSIKVINNSSTRVFVLVAGHGRTEIYTQFYALGIGANKSFGVPCGSPVAIVAEDANLGIRLEGASGDFIFGPEQMSNHFVCCGVSSNANINHEIVVT